MSTATVVGHVGAEGYGHYDANANDAANVSGTADEVPNTGRPRRQSAAVATAVGFEAAVPMQRARAPSTRRPPAGAEPPGEEEVDPQTNRLGRRLGPCVCCKCTNTPLWRKGRNCELQTCLRVRSCARALVHPASLWSGNGLSVAHNWRQYMTASAFPNHSYHHQKTLVHFVFFSFSF